MNKIMIFTFLVSLAACGPSQQDIKRNALPTGITEVRGSQILVNKSPFAELRCLNRKASVETSTSAMCSGGLGLSIFYFESRNEKWIYPLNGWAVQDRCIYLSDRPIQSLTEIEKSWDGHRVCGDKTATVLTFVSDVQISNDGKQVLFTAPGLMSDTTYSYGVEYGNVKRVRKRWVNRIF